MINWEKPKRVMSKEDWKSISADGAPPGVYTPNMSRKDMEKWKGKLIDGKDGVRVEIRKRAGPAQLVIIMREDDTVTISANGTAVVHHYELWQALTEAGRAITKRVIENKGK